MIRHAFLATSLGTPFVLAAPALGDTMRTAAAFAAIERRIGGRLGVFALDTGSGAVVAHRPEERFPMCSTFKLALVAAVLTRVDRGTLALDQPVPFTRADLLEYAPVTQANIARGNLTLTALCAAAVTVSDNTAANLLLATIGGPKAVTQFVRALGDRTTRLDRNEPSLNTAIVGDLRDTTSPRAMTTTMRAVLLGNVLSSASRARIGAWLVATTTGNERLRAGFPRGWRIGDKTGSGNNGTTNDLAIAYPPKRAPILVACYITNAKATSDERVAAHREVARAIVHAFA